MNHPSCTSHHTQEVSTFTSAYFARYREGEGMIIEEMKKVPTKPQEVSTFTSLLRPLHIFADSNIIKSEMKKEQK